MVGQLGPVSLEQSAQRWAKSHSLNHPQLDSKGVWKVASEGCPAGGGTRPAVWPQLTYLAIVHFSALIRATHASSEGWCGCQPLGSFLQFPFALIPPGGGENPFGPVKMPQVPCPTVPTGGSATAPAAATRAAEMSHFMVAGWSAAAAEEGVRASGRRHQVRGSGCYRDCRRIYG